jgi:hypothetical protein
MPRASSHRVRRLVIGPEAGENPRPGAAAIREGLLLNLAVAVGRDRLVADKDAIDARHLSGVEHDDLVQPAVAAVEERARPAEFRLAVAADPFRRGLVDDRLVADGRSRYSRGLRRERPGGERRHAAGNQVPADRRHGRGQASRYQPSRDDRR